MTTEDVTELELENPSVKGDALVGGGHESSFWCGSDWPWPCKGTVSSVPLADILTLEGWAFSAECTILTTLGVAVIWVFYCKLKDNVPDSWGPSFC
jgi:hypothetical protein